MYNFFTQEMTGNRADRYILSTVFPQEDTFALLFRGGGGKKQGENELESRERKKPNSRAVLCGHLVRYKSKRLTARKP